LKNIGKYGPKYCAVIGYWRNSTTWKLRLGSYKTANYSANHSAVSSLDHQNSEFGQMMSTVWITVVVLTPPMKPLIFIFSWRLSSQCYKMVVRWCACTVSLKAQHQTLSS